MLGGLRTTTLCNPPPPPPPGHPKLGKLCTLAAAGFLKVWGVSTWYTGQCTGMDQVFTFARVGLAEYRVSENVTPA